MQRMRASLFRTGLTALVACAAGFSALSAEAADVRAARVWAGPDYTRVVFDLSGPVSYQLRHDAGRVQIDLGNDRLASAFATPSAQGLFKGLSSHRRGGRLGDC